MIAVCRSLTPLAALAALAASIALAAPRITPVAIPAAGTVQDDVQAKFQQGVELLNQGKNEEALAAFQQVLALDPSHEAAYELWQNTDQQIFFKLLTMEGQYEQVAKRLMDLSRLGRKERSNDPDAIRGILSLLSGDDIGERNKKIRELSADYGEYAVPYLLFGLADQGDSDKRVVYMQTLTKMGSEVVPPLVEGLDSPDPFLRRNVALTLGYIEDPRAKGALLLHAATDEDQGVRDAAQQALERLGGAAEEPLARLLWEGDAYHLENDAVLRPHQVSDVIWVWSGEGLEGVEVPRILYNEEMAKKAYYDALTLEPGSVEALAGVARVSASEQAKLRQWERAGQDVAEWTERLADDVLAINVAGPEALDLALGYALDHDDQTAASGLIRALGATAGTPPHNLERALSTGGSGALRGEAAVALANIACASSGVPGSEVVSALTEAASREVVQIAAVIDGDEARRKSLSDALRERGMLVNAWPTGQRGLVSLRQIPGVDVLFVADPLPGITLHQVLAELKGDPRMTGTPVIGITADPEGLNERHGDDLAGTISGAGDLDTLGEVMNASMNADRQQANELAAEAAGALADLAATGRIDVSTSADALASTLASRPDEVVIPAMNALAFAGQDRHVASLVAVVNDGERSPAARLAAAQALGGIFGRTRSTSPEAVDMLLATVTSDAPFEVRGALAASIGRLDLDEATRASLLSAVRARLRE